MSETGVDLFVLPQLNYLLVEQGYIDFMPKHIFKTRQDNVMCQIIPYKDARTDMDILDEVVGPGNWQNDYKRDSKGVLQGGIGINVSGEWVWKWSNGVPSQFAKEKGEYSDAFKRAGFMWGIGRCLYDMPRITVSMQQDEFRVTDSNTYKAAPWFKPNDWEWTLEIEGDKYKKIVAKQRLGSSKALRYDSNPNNKKV